MNWKKILQVVGIIILQIIILFGLSVYVFALGFDGGGNTFNARLVIYPGLCFVIFLTYKQYKVLQKENSNNQKMTIFLLISAAFAIFAAWYLVMGLIGEVKEVVHKRQFKQQTITETAASRVEFDKIMTENKNVKITGLWIINGYVSGLETNKGFTVTLPGVPYTPKILDYINKKIIGASVDLNVPDFLSNQYPVSFAYQKWICQCDVQLNGQSLTKELLDVNK
jgi:magnesium-transporting ATPase (P-type)